MIDQAQPYTPWLVLSRAIWIIIFVVAFGTFVYSLPIHYALLSTPCTGVDCVNVQPTVETAQALAALGLSVQWYAVWYMTIIITIALVYCTFAMLLVWRRPADRAVWLFSLILVIIGTFITPAVDALAQINTAWMYFVNIMNSMMWLSIAVLFYTFPDGRFVPAWSWLALLPLIGLRVALFLPASLPLAKSNWPASLEPLLVIVIFGTCVYAQVYRYRRVSSPLQRQQTKWIALLLFGVSISSSEPSAADSSAIEILLEFIVTLVGLLVYLTLPLTLALAILRYRLWDIDLIIRRTLVYSVLSVMLALVYVGSVVLLQTLFRRFSGNTSSLAVVGSTLTSAALFQPFRQHIQTLIDRRFYRRKYDAQQVLSTFGATLRDEVELNRLANQLQTVVEETLQPTKVSVWLRHPHPARKDSAMSAHGPE